MRFVIVVLDGLRPDLVTAATMPHLAALRDAGTSFANARSVFPSETRVATSSLVTGCRPGAHGLVANTMFVPSVTTQHKLRTNQIADLALLGQGSSPLTRPTLGERLASSGRALAVVSTGTAGSAVLSHPLADTLGGFRWNVHTQEGRAAALVRERFGETPAPGIPNAARIAFGADVLTRYVLPELQPEIALLWCSEPDITFHAHGVGSVPARAALRLADNVVGKMVAWHADQPDAAEIGLIVLSDHGHVTGSARIGVVAALRGGGFDVADGFDAGELVVTGGAAPGFYLSNPARASELENFWRRQEWAGPLLAKNSLPLQMFGSSHARSPDMIGLFRGSEASDALGVPGSASYDAADVPVGGGMHGGLHRRELSTVLVMSGGPFRRGAVVGSYADLADVTPTLLHLLGLDPGYMDGRILAEAWRPDAEPTPLRVDITLPHGFTIEAVRQNERVYPIGLRAD